MSKSAARRSNSAVKGGEVPHLSPQRAKILELLQKGLYGPELVKAAGKSERTVREHKQHLIKMGLWNPSAAAPPSAVPVLQNGGVFKERYRVHDFTISLPIHLSGEQYLRRLKQGNTMRFEGHYVQLYPKSVVIRGAQGFSFYGVDHDDAMVKADAYWERLISRIEARQGITLLKHDCVFQRTYETAETGNDLAEQQAHRKERVQVRDKEDGTTWLVLDMSPNINAPGEVDATHRLTAGDDMQRVVAPTFNDLRDNVNSLRLPSESWRMHDELLEQTLRLAGELRSFQAEAHRTAVMQAEFFKSQAEYIKVQTDLLKSQMPKRVRAQKADFKELRRWM